MACMHACVNVRLGGDASKAREVIDAVSREGNKVAELTNQAYMFLMWNKMNRVRKMCSNFQKDMGTSSFEMEQVLLLLSVY